MNTEPTYKALKQRVATLERELSQQKKSRQTLDKEKYYLEQAQKIGNFGTWEYDMLTDTIFWTPENYRIFGFSPGTEVTGDRILEAVHPDDRKFLRDHWHATLVGKSWDIEYRVMVHGAIKWVRAKAKLIRDDQGEVVRSIGITQDITYRKTTEKKLAEAKLTAEENRYLQRELYRMRGDTIVGAQFGLKGVMNKANIASSVESPVMLLGETGVGKDVIANYIHYTSPRFKGPFITVNCGAIPETLVDSELFGHEKGAFTGALSKKRGRFERAHKGTIFLDEIGELPLQAQVRLLKVLQNREIERVGGAKTIPLDIRIITATNRNLEEMVTAKQFREDLWFRINVLPIWIPPLRDRKEDIPALVQHFIGIKSMELKLRSVPDVSPGTIDRMMNYHWPGNVRELGNIIERELILNPQGPLSFAHMQPKRADNASGGNPIKEQAISLNAVIAQHIERVLAITGGKVNGPDGAARILGVNPSTLRNRMKKLGILYGRKRNLQSFEK